MQAIPGLQYSQEQNNWFVTSGCLNIDSLPTIILRFGNLPISLTPRQYITQAMPCLLSWSSKTPCFMSAYCCRRLFYMSLL